MKGIIFRINCILQIKSHKMFAKYPILMSWKKFCLFLHHSYGLWRNILNEIKFQSQIINKKRRRKHLFCMFALYDPQYLIHLNLIF